MITEIPITLIEQGRNRLLSSWLKIVEQKSLASIINFDRTVAFFQQAQKTGQTIAFVAIGCADWVDWSTEKEKIWHVGRVDSSNKRLDRFTNEVGFFQNSLLSFGINSIINISLSNAEMFDNRPQGLDGRFDDLDLARQNVFLSNQSLTAKLAEKKINFKLFNHWQLIQQLGFVTQKSFSLYLDFIKELYCFDLSITGPNLVNSDQIGPIWLDIQSFSWPELVEAMRRNAQICAPELPILAPFINAGNWHAKPEPENRFPNAFELMQEKFNFKPANSKPEWLAKTVKLPDNLILSALQALGFQDFTIDDNWDRRKQAVDLLANIVFNNL